ncbi:MAG TPA: hypothetical protein VGF59_37605 [Bryobacteraceae bacterium]
MKMLRLIPVAAMLAIFCVPSLPAQTEKHSKSEKTATVTGCLAKGDQANEYKITDKGVTYNLFSTANVSMAEHVGHKVTVTGKLTGAKESDSNAANRTTEERLDVNNLKMVSTACQ